MRFDLAVTSRVAVLAALMSLTGSACATTAGSAVPPARFPPTEQTLPALLLPAAEVGAALGGSEPGGSGLVVTRETTTPWNDGAHFPDAPPGCTAVAGAAQQAEYSGTGWTALHARVLREPPASPAWSHFAVQAVALFPTPRAAAVFFAASRQRWASCAERELTYVQPLAPPQVWTVGPVSTDRDMLAVSRVESSPQHWFCQRALSVHETVAIDVEACSLEGPDAAAVSIARAIAGRIGPA